MTTIRGALLALGALMLLLIVVVPIWIALGGLEPASTTPPSPAASAPASPPGMASDEMPPSRVFPGPSAPEGTRSPTAHKAQSKLWTHDGRWWAAMVEPRHGTYTIHELDLATQQWLDTGVLIDERPDANPDALWDGTRLVVASSVASSGTRSAARVARYSYEAATGRFSLDPDFPILVTDRGVESIVVERDAAGRLWVCYTEGGRVWVRRTEATDEVWSEPYALPQREARVDPDDIATIVAFGGDRIGLLWSNQRAGAIHFAAHRDGDPIDTWAATETAVEGLAMADDHLNAAVLDDGRILVATKTSQDERANPSERAPLVIVHQRSADGRWSSAVFGVVRDKHTRPLAVTDDGANRLYVLAAAPGDGGTIYGKPSGLDRITFASGLGAPVIGGSADQVYQDPTSTKQNVDTTSGWVVLAFDPVAHRYVHAWIGGAGGQAGSSSGAPTPTPASAQILLSDTFEPWPPGVPVQNAWTVRADDVAELLIGADGDGRVATLTTGDASDARACKPFAPTSEGTVSASIRVRVDRRGASDAVALVLREETGDGPSIRFGERGRFSYYRGQEKVRTDVPWVRGRWYELGVKADVPAGRYAFEVADGQTGAVLLRASGVPFRDPVGVLDRICVATPGGDPTAGVSFDDVRVARD